MIVIKKVMVVKEEVDATIAIRMTGVIRIRRFGAKEGVATEVAAKEAEVTGVEVTGAEVTGVVATEVIEVIEEVGAAAEEVMDLTSLAIIGEDTAMIFSEKKLIMTTLILQRIP